jgi:DNA-binding CsgD family transcriptional regulator/PAS domain-containing protein
MTGLETHMAAANEDGRSPLAAEEAMLGLLYASIGEPDPWQDFLRAIRISTGSAAATIILQASQLTYPELLFTDADIGDNPHHGTYRTLFWRIDPFVNLPLDTVLTLDEFVGGTAVLRGGEFFRNHLEPADAPYILGIDFVAADGVCCRFRLARAAAAGPFRNETKAFCARLLPHLKRASALFCRIATAESERRFYIGVLDRLGVGVMFIDRTGTILFANGLASAILDEQDGAGKMGRRLLIRDTVVARVVQGAIRTVCDEPRDDGLLQARVIRIDRPSGRPPLGMIVKSMPAPYERQAPIRHCAVVLISDPDRTYDGQAESLAEFWGLTPAETALSLHLIRGNNLDDASAALGIRRNTARAQLRSIFAKADVHRQSDLARLFLNSPTKLI